MTVSSDIRAAGAGPTGTWQAASSRTRLGVALVIGIAAAGAVGAAGAWVYAPLAGWDVAALSYTGWLWLSVIAVMTAAQTATHATSEDPSRATTGAVIVVAAVASLAAVGFILVQATSAKGSSQDLLAGVGVLSVALSWFTVPPCSPCAMPGCITSARTAGSTSTRMPHPDTSTSLTSHSPSA